MIENKLEFPKELKRKIISRVNKKVNIIFYDGADIKTELFNISILEPFKIWFSFKGKNINVYIVEKENSVYDFFVNSIKIQNKHSMTSLISFINSTF